MTSGTLYGWAVECRGASPVARGRRGRASRKPPSTGSVAPVTKLAWSDRSQAAAVAISNGRPRRFIGLKELNLETFTPRHSGLAVTRRGPVPGRSVILARVWSRTGH